MRWATAMVVATGCAQAAPARERTSSPPLAGTWRLSLLPEPTPGGENETTTLLPRSGQFHGQGIHFSLTGRLLLVCSYQPRMTHAFGKHVA